MTKGDINAINTMIEQINNKDETFYFFNARKALYMPIYDSILGRLIKFLTKVSIAENIVGSVISAAVKNATASESKEVLGPITTDILIQFYYF
jgi:hypothetical protein